jgi:hypothetical protein
VIQGRPAWRERTSDDFFAALRDIRRSAFRLEAQPVYIEDHEQSLVDEFMAGRFLAPTEIPELAQWFEQVAAQTRDGKRIERVRIQESPPTPYQQLERWCDPWNIRAGESISYLTSQEAHDVGLLPAAGEMGDWWLLDEEILMTITHDPEGRQVQHRSTTDPSAVAQATTWRDLAIRSSAAPT